MKSFVSKNEHLNITHVFWLYLLIVEYMLFAQLEEEGFDLDFMLGRRKTDRQKLKTVTSSFSTG